MAKKDNVNVQIFTALKVGEKARNVPVLLMSNPGMGKSTCVSEFARHRGYHLQLLKGNSTSAEEIMGYDVVPTGELAKNIEKDKSTEHLRPSWFKNILKKEEEGIPTLLFLDEITTAPEHVQSALLTLIFDRRVGDEFLPESTLVVSAGNYVQNLSNQMNLIPPLMNRFLIYNVTANSSDLDSFLCKYQGALSNEDGSIGNHLDKLQDILKDMDAQEQNLDQGTINRIGEYIERSIRVTAQSLMDSGERVMSFDVTDLQSIYGDTIDDSFLYGFATPRTLCYLVDVTLASYICFGKDGLTSDSYSKMIDGLVGYGISRDKKTKEVKKTLLTPEIKESMRIAVNDIVKMNSSTIPKYEKFIKDVLQKADPKGWNVSELQVVKTKFEEIDKDKTLKNVERPIAAELLGDIIKVINNSAKNHEVLKVKIPAGSDASPREIIEKQMPPEKFAGLIEKYNHIVETFSTIHSFISKDTYKYSVDTKKDLDGLKESIQKVRVRIGIFTKIYNRESKGVESILPSISDIAK